MSIDSLKQSAKAKETARPSSKVPAKTKIKTKVSPNSSQADQASVDGNAAKDGAAFLHSLLKVRLFLALFEYVSCLVYDGKTNQVKVAKHKLAHPRYYKFCLYADTAVLSITVIILIIVAVISAMKTLDISPFHEAVHVVTS
jgi:hypothetical protein